MPRRLILVLAVAALAAVEAVAAIAGPVAPAHAAEGGGATAPSTIYAGVSVYSGGWRGTASSCTWAPHDATPGGSKPTYLYKTEYGLRYQLYDKRCPSQPLTYVWVPELDSRRLSYHATAYLEDRLPAPRASFAPPAGAGVVTVATWFWIDAWSPVSVTAWVPTATGGYRWATTTARPVALVFDPGDGVLGTGAVTCTGPGTRWRTADGDERASPAGCQYTYRHSSVRAPDGRRFAARVTIVWDVSWRSSSGAGGYAGRLRTSSSYGMTVRELQALVTS